MKKLLLSLTFVCCLFTVQAQFANWGTGVAITATQNGSTVNLSVQDPQQGNKTTSFSGDAFINNEGLVAIVTYGDKMRWVTYDVVAHSFKDGYEYLSSSSNSSNTSYLVKDGVLIFVDPGDKIKYVTYDLAQQQFADAFEYIASGNNSINCKIVTADGVVAMIDAGDKIKYACYNGKSHTWDDAFEYIASGNDNSNCDVMTEEGVVLMIDAGDKIKYAAYNLAGTVWVDAFEYIASGNSKSNCTLLCKNGVVLIGDYDDKVKYAGFLNSTWDDDYTYISGAPTGLSITDGTVYFTKSGSNYKYGYNGSNWTSGANTALQCRFYSSVESGSFPLITYLWCNSVGAATYNINAGDGHAITRRWAWKVYSQPDTYSPSLTIYNSVNNSGCSTDVEVTALGQLPAPFAVRVYPTLLSAGQNGIKVEADEIINKAEVTDLQGRILYTRVVNSGNFEISLHLASAGLYHLQLTNAAGNYMVKKLVVN